MPTPTTTTRAPKPAKPRPKPQRRRKKPVTGIQRATGLWRLLAGLPRVVLIAAILAVLAVGALGVNIAHWVIRKPSVLLAPLSGALAKTPAQTWDSYGDLFQRYATAAVPAELLAALAQMESSGDPAANTYWRWNVESPDFFGIFRPASSSVGLYQMTDPAFAEARRFCIRDHKVIDTKIDAEACSSDALYVRLLPAHAIELTAAWLDRSTAKAVEKRPATAQQLQDVAAIIHLCGGAPARAFVARGFRLARGERCGDHDPAAYLSQVHTMERMFRRLAAK